MPSYIKNMKGKIFGRWTVLEDLGICDGKHYFACKCKCGVMRAVQQGTLKSGNGRSCGCLKRDTDKGKLKHDYTGEKIGRLIVLKQTEPLPRRFFSDKNHLGTLTRMWLVKCDCGKEKIVQTQSLRRQKTTGFGSCGCWKTELNRMEREKKTPPYSHYLSRILNSARGRGITVSISYNDLLSLIPKNGVGTCHYCKINVPWIPYDRKCVNGKYNHNRMTGHNLDRKDNCGSYSLENVVVCCGLCNRTRGNNFSYEEFVTLSSALEEIQKNRRKQMKNGRKNSGRSVSQ